MDCSVNCPRQISTAPGSKQKPTRLRVSCCFAQDLVAQLVKNAMSEKRESDEKESWLLERVESHGTAGFTVAALKCACRFLHEWYHLGFAGKQS